MRTLKLLVLAAVAVLGWAGVVTALDAPHDGSFATSVTQCQSCHQLHGTVGGTLIKSTYTSNNDACLTCHDSAGASPSHFFTGGWSTGREAAPGTGGDQHKWSGSATNLGASVPTNPALSVNVVGGQLQCAVCHDAHGVRDATSSIQSTFAPGALHSSIGFDNPVGRVYPTTAVAGRMKLSAWTGAKPGGYAIKITSASTFVVSRNYGVGRTTATWDATSFNFSVGDTATQDVSLAAYDAALKVRFTVAPAVGDEFLFYVSYPFLSTSNVNDAMCLDCHKDRDMTHGCVEGSSCTADGVKVFSHPVQEAMGAVGGTTVSAANMLDADGTVGSSTTDGEGGVPNPGNDLKLVGGQVRCTTCHAPHNADSNSLTVDVR